MTDLDPHPSAVESPAVVRLVGGLLRDRRVRYVVVGAVASAIYYGVFSAGWLLSSGRIPYLALAVVANFVCAVATYPLYRRRVFHSTGGGLSGFLRFYLICIWALVFALVGLPLLIELGHLPVLLAQAIIIVVSPLINYQMSKYWAFRR